MQYSDIDIVILYANPDNHEPYQLRYYDTQLVSISKSVYQIYIDKLIQSNEVRFLRSSILSARLLYQSSDKLFNGLVQEALNIEPTNFMEIGLELAEKQIVGYLEEVHKLANGIVTRNPFLITYGMKGVDSALIHILTNYYNLFFDSENEIYIKIMQRLEEEGYKQIVSDWKLALSIEPTSYSVFDNAKALLRVYLGVIGIIQDKLTNYGKEMCETAGIILAEIVN